MCSLKPALSIPIRATAVASALVLVGQLALSPAPARSESEVTPDHDGARRPPRDPIAPMVRRMDRYLQRYEVDGVTMDWRYEVSPSEEIRQTVVCQVLAYADLYRLLPKPRLRADIVEHADFLLGRLSEIRSHTPFDGMLAYSLLSAYETTGEARFLAAAREVTDEMLAIPTSQCRLNGGLMVAMATAKDWRLTGNEVAEQKTRDILAQLVAYQNQDGSFPHWCFGSRDIHYTGWMGMELIHIARLIDDPIIAPMLSRMTTFLEGRIGPDGRAIYEEPCPDKPDCVLYYYSRATGCDFDYDTRGWTVEPAYCALLFDHARSPKFDLVTEFLGSLESGGTFADVYGYWPPPEDPEYPWTIADTSVVNMSVIFWALTTALTDRADRGLPLRLELDDVDEPAVVSVPSPPGGRFRIGPNPARGRCEARFTLAATAPVSLAIFDTRGRRVSVIDAGVLPSGNHVIRWNGRDLADRDAPSGLYFARLRAGDREERGRFVWTR
jgi:hypothetical protein